MNSVPPVVTPGRRVRFASSVQVWTWAAFAVSAAVCLAIIWLHYDQEETMRRSRRLLTDLREARLDLARGFLHLTLADDPRSPFRREEGIALLDQSIAALREAEIQVIPETVPRPEDRGWVQTFQAKATAFREQLSAYNRADAATRRDRQLPLRLAFHELERLAQRVDYVGQDALNTRAARLDARFNTTLIIAVVLLGAMCLGVYQVGRRQQAADRALRASEERLNESHQFLSELFEHSAAVVFVKDREGRYEVVNRKWEEVTGIPRENAVGKTDSHLFPGPAGEQLWASDRKVLDSGQPLEVEATIGDGPAGRTFLTVKFPVRAGDGTLRGVCGMATEITERKQAEEDVRDSESRRALALDAAHAGTWEWDLATGRNIWSDELWKLYALEPNCCEPSYEAWRQSVHPDGRARVEQELQSLVQQEAELNIEWRVKTHDNSTRWLMSRGRPVRDALGRVVRYLGVVMDITERKRAEEAARQSEQRLDFALTASHTGAWSLNLQDRTATRTLIHAQIFGYPDAEADWSMDKFLSHVVPEDRERVRQGLQSGIAAKSGWSFECRIRRADDQIRWVFIAGGFEHSGPSARISGIIQDITERKQLEQERAALEVQMRQQQKLESIGTLASGVAHEINNPLTGILNYAQLIQDRLPGDSPLAEFTGEIMHETQRVATIVRNLLTFARNEKQSHSPARIADIVEAVLSLVRAVIRHDQITLQVSVPEDLPQLKCRSQQIQQVIMNLVTNARDALNERYPGHHPDKVLSLETQLLERAERRWIRLTVQDHGTGIAPEVQERMFDPFFTTKGRDKGTGLGLSISHGIVKDHHGQWTVESEPGQFTRMHVDLPVDNGWRT